MRLRSLLIPLAMVAACDRAALPPEPPAPPGEPRALLRLGVDLPLGQRCEEAFDLGLYQHRGVELIAWDARAGRCAGRVITIRYLPGRITEKALRSAASELATKVDVLPSEGKKEP